MKTRITIAASAVALSILAGSSPAIAAAHSDFTKSYPRLKCDVPTAPATSARATAPGT